MNALRVVRLRVRTGLPLLAAVARGRPRQAARRGRAGSAPQAASRRRGLEGGTVCGVRAVTLDQAGQPRLGELPSPPGETMRVLACGLCGSDVEKLGSAPEGTVLGHEVVARRADGARLALFHHLPCGECARCRAGHESTCEAFAEPTIVPGGFAAEVAATAGDRASGRGRRRHRDLRGAARVRAPRRRARAARARAGRRPRLRRPALLRRAGQARRRGLRARRESRSAAGGCPTARSTRPSSARRPHRSTRSHPAGPCSSSRTPVRSSSTRSTGVS